MASTARHDAWQVGDSYDRYMGRWSRVVAQRFLEWVNAPPDLDWLDVGCGTGALTAAILDRCKPRSVLAVDSSADFVADARARVPDHRASFRPADAQALPLDDRSKDVIVSGLVLNFVPDRPKMLGEMRRVARAGATIGFYVWDYPGGGVEFIDAFWRTATALDPGASELAEDRRFPYCTADGVRRMAEEAGWAKVDVSAVDAQSVFKDFEDLWHPFTLGAGPAPGYCAKLSPAARERLKMKLSQALPRRADGSLQLKMRAWAAKAPVA